MILALERAVLKYLCPLVTVAFAIGPGVARRPPLLQDPQPNVILITGRVTDAGGAVLPGATATIDAFDTGVTTRSVTDSGGLYTLPRLKIGSYQMTAELTGFKRSVPERVSYAQSWVQVAGAAGWPSGPPTCSITCSPTCPCGLAEIKRVLRS